VSENILSPITGNTLMKIEPIDKDIAAYKSRSRQVVKTGGNLDPYMKQLPLLASSFALGNAYKVIFPPGVSGELMQHVNNPAMKGTYMTAIVGPDGKIIRQAGMESLAVAQAPLLAFVVMSAVTGQYFQARIESTLRKLSQQVDRIIQMILAEKESDIRSIYHFTEYVIQNLEVVRSNDDLRLSSLMNVQRNNIALYSLMKFYEKTIIAEQERMSVTGTELKSGWIKRKNSHLQDLKEEIKNTSDFLERRQICIDLYMKGRVLEIQLASIYNHGYLSDFRRILEEIGESNTDLMHKVLDVYKEVIVIHAVKEDKSMEIGGLEANRRALEQRYAYTSEAIGQFSSAIDGVLLLDKKGMECLYDGEELHLLE